MSASELSRSRWFVGSSMSMTFEGATRSRANATRARSPPESIAIFFSTSLPENRNEPSTARTQL